MREAAQAGHMRLTASRLLTGHGSGLSGLIEQLCHCLHLHIQQSRWLPDKGLMAVTHRPVKPACSWHRCMPICSNIGRGVMPVTRLKSRRTEKGLVELTASPEAEYSLLMRAPTPTTSAGSSGLRAADPPRCGCCNRDARGRPPCSRGMAN